MTLFLFSLELGAFVVGFVFLIGFLTDANRRQADSPTALATRTPSQRRQSRLTTAAFALSPVAASWVAITATHGRPWPPFALLLTAMVWLLLGLVPAVVAAMRGRDKFEAFKLRVAQQSGASFRSSVVLWTAAIVVAVVFSITY